MIIGMSGTMWLKGVGAWDAILIALGERSYQALGPLLMLNRTQSVEICA